MEKYRLIGRINLLIDDSTITKTQQAEYNQVYVIYFTS